MKPRILLADDHALLLDAFEKLLADSCDIVGVASDGRARELVRITRTPPHAMCHAAYPHALTYAQAARKRAQAHSAAKRTLARSCLAK